MCPPVAPWIKLTPVGVKKTLLIVGEPLEKTCTAIGRPSPMIFWKINGRTLLNSKSSSLTLHIPSIQEKQSGKYSCEASNEFGKASQGFEVIVRGMNVFVVF